MNKMLSFRIMSLSFLMLMCASVFAQKGTKGYNVLLASYNQQVPPITFTEKGFKNVQEKVSYSQIYKYYIYGVTSETEANQLKDDAIRKGFSFARVEDVLEDEKRGQNCCYAAQEVVSDELERLKNIFFDFDQSFLRTESKAQLNTLHKMMLTNPTYVVEVHAHTDSKGSAEYNQKLANRRKNAVVNYLRSKGIADYRLATYVHGEAAPLAKNEKSGKDTPEGRQLNRRVELVVKDLQGVKVDIVDEIKVPTNLR
ncbi:MAG: OmpA family protein [Bacteroidia bacterium]